MFTSSFYLPNYQSNFIHLQAIESTNVYKNDIKLKTSRAQNIIKNALIVPLGISIDDRSVFSSSQRVPMDYQIIRYGFNMFDPGYDMTYFNQN